MSSSDPSVFLSLPDLLRLEHEAIGFSLLARKQRVRSLLGGRHASKLRGRGLDFEEVRAYVQGDDIRNIDWKVTARTRQTHTRVYSEEKEKPALIIVDQSKSMFFGSSFKTKAAIAGELAAMAAFRVLKQGDRVGGVVLSDDAADVVYPKRDRRNILRFLERIVDRNVALAESEPGDFEGSLGKMLARINNLVTHDFLIIVISDFHRYNPRVLQALQRMGRKNDVLVAKVMDPMERELPPLRFTAGSALHDASPEVHQAVFNGQNRNLLESWRKEFDREMQSFESDLKKHHIPFFTVSTAIPTVDQLAEIFKSRNS
ncbi:DUF58 domain-containing protein [Cryomorphaceae bacterium]|nr:DUF58 domain-containing protein [Cryomorphaceae bacterium]